MFHILTTVKLHSPHAVYVLYFYMDRDPWVHARRWSSPWRLHSIAWWGGTIVDSASPQVSSLPPCAQPVGIILDPSSWCWCTCGTGPQKWSGWIKGKYISFWCLLPGSPSCGLCPLAFPSAMTERPVFTASPTVLRNLWALARSVGENCLIFLVDSITLMLIVLFILNKELSETWPCLLSPECECPGLDSAVSRPLLWLRLPPHFQNFHGILKLPNAISEKFPDSASHPR